RPDIPMPYCDEVFTGEEFVVSSLLIKRGEYKKAKEIVDAIDDRYDGEKRNPFSHIECGYHYGRGFSAFGLILSLGGFFVDNIKKEIYFSPVFINDNLNLFFSSGTGWGYFKGLKKKKTEIFEIKILKGIAKFQKITFKNVTKKKKVDVKINGKKQKIDFVIVKDLTQISFDNPKILSENEKCEICFTG
ncbi:MAG: hypothetical protein NC899_07455, partial [Candidatus Omnitrophica bacterium]|nr:hypothetical protein [Candidatus Omnitrophota bacterium]